MKKKLIFEVEVDENNLPVSIEMLSNKKKEDDIKALLISAWAAKSKETLRVDLWTKDMPVHEMYILFHQTMLGMASTLEKSTGHNKLAGALRDYCSFFADQTKIQG